MTVFFRAGLAYPRDETGCYIELVGKVTEVEPVELEDDIGVTVETREHGHLRGYCLGRYAPSVGYFARIRIYDGGGGFYRDNRITAWSIDREEP